MFFYKKANDTEFDTPLVMVSILAFAENREYGRGVLWNEKNKRIIVGGQIGFNNGIGSTESSTLRNNGWEIDKSQFGFTASVYGAYLLFSNFRLQLGMDLDTNDTHMAWLL